MADGERGQEIVMKMIQFHTLIAEASHNLPFIMFIRALLEWARNRPILTAWMPSEQDKQYALRSFRRIFQAISERDPDAARRFVKKHVEKMRALLAEPKADKKCSIHINKGSCWGIRNADSIDDSTLIDGENFFNLKSAGKACADHFRNITKGFWWALPWKEAMCPCGQPWGFWKIHEKEEEELWKERECHH